MAEVADNISRNFKRCRLEAGLTQEAAARKIGISVNQIRRYEAGRSIPREDVLVRAARVFDCDVVELLGGFGHHLLDGLTTSEAGLRIGGQIQKYRGSRAINEIAEKANIPPEHLIWYEGGVTIPSQEVAERLAKVLGCPANRLMAGHPELRASVVWENEKDLGGEYVIVTHFNIKVSGGVGELVGEKMPVQGLAFRHDWMKRRGLSVGSLSLVDVTGDSMVPTLHDGDIVMIDTDQTVPKDDSLYVLRLDGHLLVKRLQRMPGGKVHVVSDNQQYKAFTIDLAKPPADLAIVGRVVWAGRDL